VSILVTPWAFSVAAVVTMIKKAMKTETDMPIHVSIDICVK